MSEAFLWVVHGAGSFLLGWGLRGLVEYQRRLERNKQRGMQE